MNALFIAALFILPFGWILYKLLRYSAVTVGDEWPLKQVVQYTCSKDDILKWSQLPWMLIVFPLLWVCYTLTRLLIQGVGDQTPGWAYAVVAMLWAMLIGLLVLTYHFFSVEQQKL